MLTVDDVSKYLNNNCHEYDKVLLKGQVEAVKIYCEARDYLALDQRVPHVFHMSIGTQGPLGA